MQSHGYVKNFNHYESIILKNLKFYLKIKIIRMNQYSELKFSETFSIFLGKIIGFICFLFFISTFPLNFAKFINPEIKIVLLLVVLFFISYIFFIDREKKIIFFF